ncbi:MAG TPA: hypothetical protein VGJ95_24055 [Pseudonocardiaceae bacterium]|jgi:hypothetical protein
MVRQRRRREVERRRDWYLGRVEQATTPAERVAAATDYLRAELNRTPDDEIAARVAESIIEHVLKAVRALTNEGTRS